jgi:hypothetical protein
MNRTIEIIIIIILNITLVSCQDEKVLYHECCTTASSLKIDNWNINDKDNRCAMRETIDEKGRVKRLEFLINNGGPSLCYLPTIVEYEYTENTITETLFDNKNEKMIANECEMNYKTIYHLSDGYIIRCETFFHIDSVLYSPSEIEESKKYIKPYVVYEVADTINTFVEFYALSFAKYNGKFPTNKGYEFADGNYYYDIEPMNSEFRKALEKNKNR